MASGRKAADDMDDWCYQSPSAPSLSTYCRTATDFTQQSIHSAAAAAYIKFPVTTRGGCLISACRLVMRRNNRFRLDRLKRQARYCTTVYPHSTAVPLSPKCLLFYSWKKCNYDYDNIAINKCDQILVFSNHCYFLQPRAPLN